LQIALNFRILLRRGLFKGKQMKGANASTSLSFARHSLFSIPRFALGLALNVNIL
jgi:hypothetical protein